MVGGKRMNWMENLLIIAGVSLDIFAAMECQGSLVAKINKKNLTVICGIVALAQLITLYLGHFLSSLFCHYRSVPDEKLLGQIISMVIFMILGIRLMVKAIRNEHVEEHLEHHLGIRRFVRMACISGIYTLLTGIAFGFLETNVLMILIMIVEKGLTKDVLSSTKDEYTRSLINSTFKNKDFRYTLSLIYQTVEDEFKDIEFFLIERIKLQDVLNKENLYDFLQERRNILTNIFEEDNEVIFMEENFKVKANTIVSRNKRFYYSNMFFENFTLLQFDINILKNSNLLTSRLANYIYKICLLYVYSTDKSIGNKVHDTLEVGSKPYTFEFIKHRGLKIANISSLFLKKPVRCYDLTINENVLEAKIRILKNLISLSLPNLDINKMVQIVELSNIEIKEIKDSEIKSYIKDLKKSNTNL
jgi:putative Mn2+ efflux pump MntP